MDGNLYIFIYVYIYIIDIWRHIRAHVLQFNIFDVNGCNKHHAYMCIGWCKFNQVFILKFNQLWTYCMQWEISFQQISWNNESSYNLTNNIGLCVALLEYVYHIKKKIVLRASFRRMLFHCFEMISDTD